MYANLNDPSKLWVVASRQNLAAHEKGPNLLPNKHFLKIPVQEDSVISCSERSHGVFHYTIQEMCTTPLIMNILLSAGSGGAPLHTNINGVIYVGGIIFGVDDQESPSDFTVTYATRISQFIEWIEDRVWSDEK